MVFEIASSLGWVTVKIVRLSSRWWCCTRVGGGGDSNTENVVVRMGHCQDGIPVGMVWLLGRWQRWTRVGGQQWHKVQGKGNVFKGQNIVVLK